MNPNMKAVSRQISQEKYPLELSLGKWHIDLIVQVDVLVCGRGYRGQGGSHLGIDSAMSTSAVFGSLKVHQLAVLPIL